MFCPYLGGIYWICAPLLGRTCSKMHPLRKKITKSTLLCDTSPSSSPGIASAALSYWCHGMANTARSPYLDSIEHLLDMHACFCRQIPPEKVQNLTEASVEMNGTSSTRASFVDWFGVCPKIRRVCVQPRGSHVRYWAICRVSSGIYWPFSTVLAIPTIWCVHFGLGYTRCFWWVFVQLSFHCCSFL